MSNSHTPLPGGGRLQADVGHWLAYRQEDLDVGEGRGHGRGTGPVAIVHGNLGVRWAALPLGVQVEWQRLGAWAGELERKEGWGERGRENICRCLEYTALPAEGSRGQVGRFKWGVLETLPLSFAEGRLPDRAVTLLPPPQVPGTAAAPGCNRRRWGSAPPGAAGPQSEQSC